MKYGVLYRNTSRPESIDTTSLTLQIRPLATHIVNAYREQEAQLVPGTPRIIMQ